MKYEILIEITNFCEECHSHECCPEEECVLFRIEKIIEKKEMMQMENTNAKLVEMFKTYMKERGYQIWLEETPNMGITHTASKEVDRYIPFFEFTYGNKSKYNTCTYAIVVYDRNGEEGLHGNSVAHYHLYTNANTSEEEIIRKFQKMLDDSYNKYFCYSRDNRLDSIFKNLKTEFIDYLEENEKINLYLKD